ncbi:SNF1-related protein kinase [Musa troglodytarum]|uniref:non-specific serine/threonine protein kinase n=1 Tax=Musa troglodytarum TaxID=320322 RepID=A0A9E7GWR7_9LILI|nr:SNF1-related protein kinase [Musa troglodytarum]
MPILGDPISSFPRPTFDSFASSILYNAGRREPRRIQVTTSGMVISHRSGGQCVQVKMEGSGRGGGNADVVLQNYKLGKTLGIGSFGKVKIADHLLTGHKVAIKILNRRKIKNMEMEEKVRREIKILRLFMHPHIIRLYEVIETQSDIYVVMEYVKSGELFDYIVEKGRLQEDEARRFFQQIISGVEYCHRNMVVHRDLKPENLLLDSKCDVKIADFGLSNVMRDGHFLKTSCGSPNYAAPEVISGKLYAGPEVDVWSCGVILYALLCGTLPFDDENIPNLFKKIKGGIYTLPSHLSALARDLIPRMLIVDPMKRITIREIREHPWFQTRLPRYLAVPPPDTMQQAKKIEEDILQEVIRMGFDKNQLVESLHNRIQNEATVSYYLLLDNRFRAMSGYLGGDFQETMDYGFSRMGSSEAPAIAHRLPGCMDPPGIGLRPSVPVEKKWALGLQSRAHPREIMTEVLKALRELNVCWKKIGHYNMKCRYFSGISDHAESMFNDSLHANHSVSDESAIVENDNVFGKDSSTIKFEIQLYKTREEKYLLDLQRVSGPQLLFLDLCAAFLAQLRNRILGFDKYGGKAGGCRRKRLPGLSCPPLGFEVEVGMENSLRYDGDSKSLRIHAKEKIPLASKTLLQVHGELDTGTGTSGYRALIVRHFYPELSASMGFGIQLNKDEKLSYSLRGKKAFPVTASGLVAINLKGRFPFDKEYKEARGAVELAWSVLNFQKDQDVRIKIGYDICDQVPYFQIRENNWTLNADIDGKWNVRFDL